MIDMVITTIVGLPLLVVLLTLMVVIYNSGSNTGDQSGLVAGVVLWLALCVFFSYSVGLFVRPWLVWVLS